MGDLAARAKGALDEQRAGRGLAKNAMTPQVILGFVLIVIGAAFLFSRFIDLWFLGWRFGWPAIIIAAGVLVILRAWR